jgi:UDP-glucuronate decarboxylase
MKVLVTGGAGFIGSHLCRSLLKKGYDVICLDNFYTGTLNNFPARKSEFLEIVNADVINPMSFEIDQIYNLACPASPPHYQADPIKTLKTNVLGSINVLDLAREQGARVLQASTSEVYGDPLVHPQDENYWGNVNPIGERSCYDEGKRCAETLFRDYKRFHDVDARIVRIFNTYGPGMHPEDGRVVSNFIVQALTGQDLTIYGTGTQTRSFCYIDDLIRGLLSMMEYKGDIDGPINIGNPQEFKVIDLANIVLDLTNSTSKVAFLPLPSDDPKKRKPDITKAKKYLEWEPSTQVIDGITETIKYFSRIL